MEATGSFVFLLNQLIQAVFEDYEPQPPRVERPSRWAQPVEMEGVAKLYRMTDHVFRSAEPSVKGLQNLKNAGIKTIVNLRAYHSNREQANKFGFAFEQIYIKTWHLVENEIVRFLQIMTDPARYPVLVHCHHGADRTGTMCAIYRIVLQGWSKKEAIAEMTEGGFGFHTCWVNLIPHIRRLDVDRIRQKAGLS